MGRRVERIGRTAVVVLVLGTVLVPAVGRAAEPGPASGKRYIVLFDEAKEKNPKARSDEHAKKYKAKVENVYSAALSGYVATFEGDDVSEVEKDPAVKAVEPEAPIELFATQTDAVWGLDRVDQRTRPVNGSYTYTADGAGVTVYVIDTGVRTSHAEFAGRASVGHDAIAAGDGQDCHGHGSHVAGTIAGVTYGVAKGADVVSVRVFDCAGGGTNVGLLGAIDWVALNRVADAPAVANLSLGGGASTALDTAVKGLITAGITTVVAAGNGNARGVAQDACKTSPARLPEAITIGATDNADAKASFSNYGKCVDFFAPGVGIKSAWFPADTATNTISGTSMATPHVAGVAALYLQGNPTATPAQVRTALYDLTTKGIVTNSKTTTNHLLFSNL